MTPDTHVAQMDELAAVADELEQITAPLHARLAHLETEHIRVLRRLQALELALGITAPTATP